MGVSMTPCARVGDTSTPPIKLGFETESLVKFKRNIDKPYGIVLVTGPTGSGKTNTLYSALASLNKPDINIMTAEDPRNAERKRPVVNRAEEGLDVVTYHLVERRALGLMAPIRAGRGTVCGRRGGSQRPTPRCRLTSEPWRHYVRSLRRRLRWGSGVRQAPSIWPSGMRTPRRSRERPRG